MILLTIATGFFCNKARIKVVIEILFIKFQGPNSCMSKKTGSSLRYCAVNSACGSGIVLWNGFFFLGNWVEQTSERSSFLCKSCLLWKYFNGSRSSLVCPRGTNIFNSFCEFFIAEMFSRHVSEVPQGLRYMQFSLLKAALKNLLCK